MIAAFPLSWGLVLQLVLWRADRGSMYAYSWCHMSYQRNRRKAGSRKTDMKVQLSCDQLDDTTRLLDLRPE